MTNLLKILMLEDSMVDAEIIMEFLLQKIPGCEFKLVMTEEEYIEALDQYRPDLILSDNTLPQFSAMEALEIFNQRSRSIPFILVTGTVSEEFAAGIIKLGADDYILKDRLGRLPSAIDAALKKNKIDSERREAEEKLRFKANLLNTVGQAVIATDISGIVTYWNNAAEKIYQWTTAEAIGKNIIDLTPTNQTKEQAIEIMGELRNGKIWNGEFMVKRKDGTEFPAFVTTTPVYDQEQILTGIIGCSVDVSEQKKAEESLRVMEKKMTDQKMLEQKRISRAVIEAHEEEKNRIGLELHDNINQILAGIKLHLGMASSKDEKIKTLLQYPMELIDHTIEELRQLSSRQVTPLKNIDLEELVKLLLDTLNKSDIKTVFNYSVRSEFLADDLKLNIYRLLQEQVNNIIKHADAKNVSISLQAASGEIAIIVRDDGKGFNVNNKRTGIGISNMMNRINFYNGKLFIESEAGKGCTVDITIPY